MSFKVPPKSQWNGPPYTAFVSACKGVDLEGLNNHFVTISEKILSHTLHQPHEKALGLQEFEKQRKARNMTDRTRASKKLGKYGKWRESDGIRRVLQKQNSHGEIKLRITWITPRKSHSPWECVECFTVTARHCSGEARPSHTSGWLRKQTVGCRNFSPVRSDKLTPNTNSSEACSKLSHVEFCGAPVRLHHLNSASVSSQTGIINPIRNLKSCANICHNLSNSFFSVNLSPISCILYHLLFSLLYSQLFLSLFGSVVLRAEGRIPAEVSTALRWVE